jgi:anthranilate phosphoribosyltransferase
VLDGEPGPCRDIVVVNAAAALLLAQTTHDVKSALAKAAESIDTGSARTKLDQLRELTSELKS